jgi:outer membrane protein OmpA-like peptidoglycan-associated protein
MASLLDMARDAVTPSVVERASGLIGENATVTGRGLASAVPSVFAGVLGQASSPSGAERLLSTVTGGRYGADTLSGLGRQLGAGGTTETLLSSGGRLLSSLFGNQVDGVADAVAGAGGLGRGAATTLLRLAAPIVMGVLGSRVASGGLDAGGLSRLLTGERSSILNAAPAGLANLLGLREPVTVPDYEGTARASRRREPIEPPVEPARERTGRSWWPAALAALAALALLYFLTPGRQTQTARVETPRVEPPAAPVAKPEPPPAPTPATRTEPPAPAASVREPAPPAPPATTPSASPPSASRDVLGQLSEFLTGTEATPRSFTLDDVNFETGSARLTPSAQQTVASLAGLLKAHPSARVRLEGHTDSSGSEAANKRLSEQRAAAVKSALVAAGAAPASIEVAGRGSEQPVADNNSDDGQAQNRRTELVVLQR